MAKPSLDTTAGLAVELPDPHLILTVVHLGYGPHGLELVLAADFASERMTGKAPRTVILHEGDTVQISMGRKMYCIF